MAGYIYSLPRNGSLAELILAEWIVGRVDPRGVDVVRADPRRGGVHVIRADPRDK